MSIRTEFQQENNSQQQHDYANFKDINCQSNYERFKAFDISIHNSLRENRKPKNSDRMLKYSQSHPYLIKLHGIIHQYEFQIKQNLPTLQNLQKQCTIYRKICHKQREKIQKNCSSNSSVKALIEQYQKELHDLNLDKIHLQKMINTVQEQSDLKAQQNQQILFQLSNNQLFLQQNYHKLRQQTLAFENILKNKELIRKNLQIRMKDNERIIRQKQNVQRKYQEVTKMIRQLEMSKRNQQLNNGIQQTNHLKPDSKTGSRKSVPDNLKFVANMSSNKRHQNTPVQPSHSKQVFNENVKVNKFDEVTISQQFISE